ncbi:hypothetical protein [Streptomyces sp. NPDC056683]|uniref:hypothetical protein n=1 Tax=Streptomyces sp. NPDC056683 TaxID=3345910 RepID=UPI0036C771B1
MRTPGVELNFDNVVAIFSVVIPVLAFFREFAVIRRKRLGYRLQMDATAGPRRPTASERTGRTASASSGRPRRR